MNLTDPAKRKAQQNYDSAANNFAARPLGFWARYGQRTVERLDLITLKNVIYAVAIRS